MWKLLRNLLLVAIMLAGVLKLVLWYEVRQRSGTFHLACIAGRYRDFRSVQAAAAHADGRRKFSRASGFDSKGPAAARWCLAVRLALVESTQSRAIRNVRLRSGFTAQHCRLPAHGAQPRGCPAA